MPDTGSLAMRNKTTSSDRIRTDVHMRLVPLERCSISSTSIDISCAAAQAKGGLYRVEVPLMAKGGSAVAPEGLAKRGHGDCGMGKINAILSSAR